jgi:hypothetical protein
VELDQLDFIMLQFVSKGTKAMPLTCAGLHMRHLMMMLCSCAAGAGGLSQLLSDLQEPADAAEYRIKIQVR